MNLQHERLVQLCMELRLGGIAADYLELPTDLFLKADQLAKHGTPIRAAQLHERALALALLQEFVFRRRNIVALEISKHLMRKAAYPEQAEPQAEGWEERMTQAIPGPLLAGRAKAAPLSRPLPVDRWPEHERAAWLRSLAPGLTPLDRSGNRRVRWPDLLDVSDRCYKQVILATAHLNHDPRDHRLRNLRALCQRCHLLHDRVHHMAQRRITHRKRWATGDLGSVRQRGGIWSQA